ncbi:hypothetical protein CATRI_02395 [Corynebacterium atrinae]|nr:hypothetical protein CATRI_02395 [Corynebacterium atrinae]
MLREALRNSVASVNYDSQMPLDPFADDPNDPASFLEADEPAIPLTEEERSHMQSDLEMLRRAKVVLAPRGILGVFYFCEDCEDPHYYDWNIMEQNLLATLAGELPPVHEPSARPDINAYVSWDYAAGYLDGVNDRRL